MIHTHTHTHTHTYLVHMITHHTQTHLLFWNDHPEGSRQAVDFQKAI